MKKTMKRSHSCGETYLIGKRSVLSPSTDELEDVWVFAGSGNAKICKKCGKLMFANELIKENDYGKNGTNFGTTGRREPNKGRKGW